MWRKLSILSVFYFVQGLPYGFQLTALPVYLREAGMSLATIGLASAVSLPWVLKVVWGPAVDRFGSTRFGRRRSWILPLQVLLLMAVIVAAFVPPQGGLGLLLAAVVLMNVFASTMDVAVDGLAVDMLKQEELGYGNIAQVVGYKLGILTGGGLLVWASGRIGWQGLFFAMAGLIALALLVTIFFREREHVDAAIADEPAPTFGTVARLLVRAMRLPGTAWLLIFIGTYKLGETFADAMWKPFLYDAGYDRAQIGLWVGTWGMLFSLAGSALGGILASRTRILVAVAITAFLRAVAVGGEWWVAVVGPTAERVVVVIAGEQLFGGALTVAMFAYMMSRVDRRIGATHYTLLATVEVLGKLSASSMSGFIAERIGYAGIFGLATILAFLFLALLWPIDRGERRSLSPAPPPMIA